MKKISKNNLCAIGFKYILTIAIILLFILTFFSNNIKSSALDNKLSKTYYKSIIIEPADSLFKIASKYNNSIEFNDREYVRELMKINNLSHKKIYSGNSLIVFYYGE